MDRTTQSKGSSIQKGDIMANTTLPTSPAIHEAVSIRRFITAGKAYFTVASVKTGNRFTYRVRKSPDGAVWFVAILTGTENTSCYSYMGYINGAGDFKTTKKSQITETAPSLNALGWHWNRVTNDNKDLPEGAEFIRSSRCGRCAKVLTTPESVTQGYGPECINLVDHSALRFSH